MESGTTESPAEIEIPARDGVSAVPASTVAMKGTGIRALRTIIIGTIAVLFLYSLHLAINRIIQVDEAQNLFMARVIGSGETARYFVNPAIFLIGPLAWISESAASAREAFAQGRLIFAGIFWLNIFLMAKCTGTAIRTQQGLWALLAAATLAPLWDYGFEIRHDNILLSGILLIWLLGRFRGSATSSYFAIGLLTAVLQFIAFKAFVYTVPLSAYFLIRRAVTEPPTRLRPVAAWLAGVALACLTCLSIYITLGLLPALLENTTGLGQAKQTRAAFLPFNTLSRLLFQTPLLVALSVAALVLSAKVLIRNPRAMFEADGLVPDAFLLLIAMAALFINPTPFPYNLVNVVPFAFLLAYGCTRRVLPVVMTHKPVLVLAASILIFSHLVPFFQATLRHLDWSNWRQMKLAAAAEAMTDPTTDPVYDAAGLVLTRHSIDRWWYLHSLNMQLLHDGRQSSVATMLTQRPAAVLIPNYRFDWLPESDWQFIRANYLPVADDFWVLGAQLPSGGGEIRTLRSGRYQVLFGAGLPQHLSPEFTVDGHPARSIIVPLHAGNHIIATEAAVPLTVVWLGPTLDRLPSIGAGNHRFLFTNWY